MGDCSGQQAVLADAIVGRQLSSIEFLQDYLQLRFDGTCLTAVTVPEVSSGGVLLAWNDPGYRDALCAQIARTVEAVEIRSGDALEIRFGGGVTFRVSLRDADYRCQEAVVFTTGNDWWVL